MVGKEMIVITTLQFLQKNCQW